MGEWREMVKSLTILAVVSTVTFIVFTNPPTLDSAQFSIVEYDAHLTQSGILYENFTYSIYSDMKLHMLYRLWTTPLYYGPMGNAGIYLLNISYKGNLPNAIPYVKTYSSGLYILNNASYSSTDVNYIASKADRSEAGIYVPSGIPAGKYTVSYTFLLYPVLEKHGDYYHLPLDLGSIHYTYLHSRISIPANLNPQGPPYLQKNRVGSSIVYTGKIYSGFTLVFDLLFTNATKFSHYSIKNVGYNLPSYIQQAHMYETLRYYLAYSLFTVPYYIVILIPVIYLIIFLLFGRDYAKPIEDEVITPPNHWRPWVVNYIFKNQGTKLDYRDAIIATLLNMHKEGIIEISEDGTKIKVLKENPVDELDDYEWLILQFIRENSEGGVLDLSVRKKVCSKEKLLIDPELENKIFDKFMYLPDNRIGYTVLFIPAYLILALISLGIILPYMLFMLWGFMLLIPYAIQIYAIWKYPEVLGRWKDDYYTEKLRWDKFRDFLSDENKVRKYSEEFRLNLDDWLIYGYALGVGDKVRTALNAPEIAYSLAVVAEKMHSYVPLVFITPSSSATSGGTAGGFGGGFGGGGAGAR